MSAALQNVVPLRPAWSASRHIEWAARGYGAAVLPVIPPDAVLSANSSVPPDQRGKLPGMEGQLGWFSFSWRGHEASQADLTRWARMNAGVGLQSRLWPGLDIDVLDARVSDMVAALARKVLGPAVRRIGRAPKQLLPYRLAPGAEPFGKRRYAFRLNGVDMAVEMLADKQFYVVAGIHPGTGKPYAWPDGEPAAADLSPVTGETVDAFFDQLEQALDMVGAEPVKRSRETAGAHALVDQAHLVAPSAAVLEDAMPHVPNTGGYDDWIPGLCAIKAAAAGVVDDGGRELARAWTDRWAGGGQGAHIDFDGKWEQLVPPFSVGWGWLESTARAAGWTGAAAVDFAGVQVVPTDEASIGHNGGPPLANPTSPAPTRVTIRYCSAQMHEQADAALKVMQSDLNHSPIFRFAGSLASVVAREATTAGDLRLSSKARGCAIRVLNEHTLRDRIMRSCRVFLSDRAVPREEAPPLDWCKMMLARRGDGLPLLLGITTVPLLRDDGSLVDAPGYDTHTGIWCDFDPEDFSDLPTKPTKRDAEAALAWLRANVLEGFPCVGEGDEAVAVAAFLTGLRRRTSGPAPAFLFTAPTPGSGKTALAEMLSQLAFGAPASPQPWPLDEVEREKAIFSALRDGSPAALLDNAPDGTALDSAALARAISGHTFKSRILGVSEMAEVPASALWLMTGNNIRAVGDLATRTLECQLDARVERPDQRRHRRHDLAAWAASNRARAVVAGLTIMQAHAVAGGPSSVSIPSRFANWDTRVRAPLAWAWGADHVATKIAGAYVEDPRIATHSRLMDAWLRAFGDREVSASDIAGALANPTVDFEGTDGHADIRDCLEALGHAPSRGRVSPEWVGRSLQKIADGVVGGRRIVKSQHPVRRTTLFRLETVAPAIAGSVRSRECALALL